MADQEVALSFSASDDGLSATLQQIQQQLQGLNSAAQSVDLSTLAQSAGSLDALTQSLQQTTQAGQQYQDTATQMAAVAADQASALQQTGTASEQLTSQLSDTVSATQQASDALTTASDAAQQLAPATQDAADAATALVSSQGDLATAVQANTDAVTTQAGALDESGGKLVEHGEHSAEASVNLKEFGNTVSEVGGTALPGLGGALDQVSGLFGTVKEASSDEAATLATLGAGFGAMGLAVAGITFEGFESGVESLHQLALESGLSTAQVQGLESAMQAAGVSTNTTQTMISIMARQLQAMQNQIDQGKQPTGNFAIALQDLGIQATDATGHVRSMGDLLPQIMDAFQQSAQHAEESGTQFNAAGLAVDLFGRSGAQLVPVLEQGSAGVADFTQKAEQLGIGSEQQVKALEDWNQAQANLRLETTAFVDQVGSSVAPILTQLATGAGQVVQEINQLPGPVKELVITLPLAASAFFLVASGVDALIGKSVTAVTSLFSMSTATEAVGAAEAEATPEALGFAAAIDAASGPIGLVVAAAGAAAIGIELLTGKTQQHTAAQEADTAAVTGSLPAIQQQIALWQQAGLAVGDITAKLQAEVAAANAKYQQDQNDIAVTQQKIAAEQALDAAKAHGRLTPGAIEQADPALRQLNSTLADQVANLNSDRTAADNAQKALDGFTKQQQDAASATSDANTAVQTAIGNMNAAGLAAAQHADALKNIDTLAKQAAQSTDQQRIAESALTDVMNAEASGAGAVTQLQQNINTLKQSGVQYEKDYAAAVEAALNATTDYGGGVQGATTAQQAFNDALSQTPQKLNALLTPAQAISQAFGDALASVNKLADAFNPAKAQIDALQLSIDKNKQTIDAWNATLANSSAMDRKIAALTQQIDKERESGQATAATTKELDTNLASLDANGRALAQQIITQQQHIDKITDENTSLGAQQQVYRTQQAVATDTATVQKDESDRAAKAYQDGAISIQQSSGAVDTALGGVATASTSMANTFSGALHGIAQYFDQIAAHMTTTAGSLANTLRLAFAGLGGAASGLAGPATGNATNDIMAWAKANAGRFGVDPQTLATMEIGLNQYETGGSSSNPFQFMNDLAAQYGQNGSAGSQLDVLAGMGRVGAALQAYLAAGGGALGLEAAENIQEIPGQAAIDARGFGALQGAYAAAAAATGGGAAGLPNIATMPALPDVGGAGGASLPIPTPSGSSGSSSAGAAAKQATDYTSALDQVTQQLAKDQQTLNTLQTDYSKLIVIQTSAQQGQTAATQAQVVATNQLGKATQEAAQAIGPEGRASGAGAEAGPGGARALGIGANGSGGAGGLGGSSGPAGGGGGLQAAADLSQATPGIIAYQHGADGAAESAAKLAEQTQTLTQNVGTLSPAMQQLVSPLDAINIQLPQAYANMNFAASGASGTADSLNVMNDALRNAQSALSQTGQEAHKTGQALSDAAHQGTGDWLDGYNQLKQTSAVVTREQVDNLGAVSNADATAAQQANTAAQAADQQAIASSQHYQQLLQDKKNGIAVSDQELQAAKDQSDADQKNFDILNSAATNSSQVAQKAWGDATTAANAYDAEIQKVTADLDNAGNQALQFSNDMRSALTGGAAGNFAYELTTPQDLQQAQENLNQLQDKLGPALAHAKQLHDQYMADLQNDPLAQNAQTQQDQNAYDDYMTKVVNPLQQAYQKGESDYNAYQSNLNKQTTDGATFRANANQQGLQTQLNADHAAFEKAAADLRNDTNALLLLYQQYNDAKTESDRKATEANIQLVHQNIEADSAAMTAAVSGAQAATQAINGQTQATQNLTQATQQQAQAAQQAQQAQASSGGGSWYDQAMGLDPHVFGGIGGWFQHYLQNELGTAEANAGRINATITDPENSIIQGKMDSIGQMLGHGIDYSNAQEVGLANRIYDLQQQLASGDLPLGMSATSVSAEIADLTNQLRSQMGIVQANTAAIQANTNAQQSSQNSQFGLTQGFFQGMYGYLQRSMPLGTGGR